MKHRISGRKFGRNRQQRQALFRSLVSSLIRHGFVTTTHERAKTVRPIAEKLVTTAKGGTLSAARRVHDYLQSSSLTQKLVQSVLPALNRASGFTRIVKTDIRRGDSAQMARLEWVALPEAATVAKSPEKKAKPKVTKKRPAKTATKPAVKSPANKSEGKA